MKDIRKLISLILLFSSVNIFASDTLDIFGNKDKSFSVFVYDCGEKSILLDYHELFNIESSYQYDLNESDNVYEVLDELLKRSEKYSLPRTSLFKKWLKYLDTEVKFLKNVNFGVIKDEFDFTQKKGCEIKTLGKVVNPTLRGKGIFIDETLWEKLDVKSRAGAFFNILINLDYIFFNGNDVTVYSRFLNAFLASHQYHKLDRLSVKLSLFQEMNLKTIHYKGLFYDLIDVLNYKIPFEINEKEEIVFARFSLVPFAYRGLGYENVIKIDNISGLEISSIAGEVLDRRKVNKFSLRDAIIHSNCAGGYYIPKIPLRILLSHDGTGFQFHSLFSYRLKYREKLVRKIISKDDQVIIPFQKPDSISASHIEEIKLCHEVDHV